MSIDPKIKLDKFLSEFDKKVEKLNSKQLNNYADLKIHRFEFTKDFKRLEQEVIRVAMVKIRTNLISYGHSLDYLKSEIFINRYPSVGYKVDIKNEIGSFVMLITGEYDRDLATVENFTQNGEFLLSSNSYNLDQLDQDVLEDEIKNGFLFFSSQEVLL